MIFTKDIIYAIILRLDTITNINRFFSLYQHNEIITFILCPYPCKSNTILLYEFLYQCCIKNIPLLEVVLKYLQLENIPLTFILNDADRHNYRHY